MTRSPLCCVELQHDLETEFHFGHNLLQARLMISQAPVFFLGPRLQTFDNDRPNVSCKL